MQSRQVFQGAQGALGEMQSIQSTQSMQSTQSIQYTYVCAYISTRAQIHAYAHTRSHTHTHTNTDPYIDARLFARLCCRPRCSNAVVGLFWSLGLFRRYFFQFHGLEKPAIDERTVCKVLGEAEARKQLSAFRDQWVTEETFKKIAEIGLNAVRIPYGYWIWEDQDEFCPNINHIKYLDSAVAWARKYGLRVHLDLHGVKPSQNGQDNSGESFKGSFSQRWHGGPPNFDAAAWMRSPAKDTTLAVLHTRSGGMAGISCLALFHVFCSKSSSFNMSRPSHAQIRVLLNKCGLVDPP